MRASEARSDADLCFEFLVLTATRSGEVRGAAWKEIDREGCVWTIPAARTKGIREHRVPLGHRAMEVLGDARARSRQTTRVSEHGRRAAPEHGDVATIQGLADRGGFPRLSVELSWLGGRRNVSPPRGGGSSWRLGRVSGGPESRHRDQTRPRDGSEAASGLFGGISGKLWALESPRIGDRRSPRATSRVDAVSLEVAPPPTVTWSLSVWPSACPWTRRSRRLPETGG